MSLEKSVLALCSKSHELNDYVDRVNGRTRQIEQQLRSAGVGIEVWLYDEPLASEDPQSASDSFVGWSRWEKQWCLAWSNERDNPEAEHKLLESPRWARVAAFSKLPLLVERLDALVSAELATLAPLKEDLPATAAGWAPPSSDVPF